MNTRELAERMVPGSLEARHVYGCTCGTDLLQHARRDAAFVMHEPWNPNAPTALWQAVLQPDCPAHGHLSARRRV